VALQIHHHRQIYVHNSISFGGSTSATPMNLTIIGGYCPAVVYYKGTGLGLLKNLKFIFAWILPEDGFLRNFQVRGTRVVGQGFVGVFEKMDCGLRPSSIFSRLLCSRFSEKALLVLSGKADIQAGAKKIGKSP
jgi:hypothetical protein